MSSFKAIISPPCLSQLLSKASTQDFSCLLIGKVKQRKVKTFRDDGDEYYTTNYTFVVSNWIQREFYSSTCEMLDNEHQDWKNVIGWMRFRRNSPHQISIRETLITKNFPIQPSIFLLMTASDNLENYINTTEWSIMLEFEGNWVNVPLTIANLSNTQADDYHFDALSSSNLDLQVMLKQQSIFIAEQEKICTSMMKELTKVVEEG